MTNQKNSAPQRGSGKRNSYSTNITGVHHAAVNVSDMERSIAFYRQFGFQPLFPTQTYSGKDLDKTFNVKGAKLRSALLRGKDGSTIELLQYLRPRGRPYNRRNSDIGNMHVAFRVHDIDRAYAKLKKNVLQFNSEPSTVKK